MCSSPSMLCTPQAKELAYLHCGDFFLFFIWIAARQYLQNLPVEAQVMFLQTSFKFLMDVLRLLISPRSPGCSDVLLSGRPSALLLYFSFKWVNVLDLRFKEALHVIMVMLKFLYPLLCITQHLVFCISVSAKYLHSSLQICFLQLHCLPPALL